MNEPWQRVKKGKQSSITRRFILGLKITSFALMASQGNIRHFPVTHLQAGCFAIQNRS